LLDQAYHGRVHAIALAGKPASYAADLYGTSLRRPRQRISSIDASDRQSGIGCALPADKFRSLSLLRCSTIRRSSVFISQCRCRIQHDGSAHQAKQRKQWQEQRERGGSRSCCSSCSHGYAGLLASESYRIQEGWSALASLHPKKRRIRSRPFARSRACCSGSESARHALSRQRPV
jgi:hypothetical protein